MRCGLGRTPSFDDLGMAEDQRQQIRVLIWNSNKNIEVYREQSIWQSHLKAQNVKLNTSKLNLGTENGRKREQNRLQMEGAKKTERKGKGRKREEKLQKWESFIEKRSQLHFIVKLVNMLHFQSKPRLQIPSRSEIEQLTTLPVGGSL